MANNYFQFKQFTVYQDRVTLKVSTDSCLFGAWLAEKILGFELQLTRCLDIGAGTGLLMLMLAQRFPGIIDGIEIDHDSCRQAAENTASSPWHDRLFLFREDVKLFALPHRYDFIFSNPPFYEGDLKSNCEKKNMAKHDTGLGFDDLLSVADRNLTATGRFAVLLPWHRTAAFETLAATYGLFASEKLLVRQTTAHPFFRSALLLGRKDTGKVHQEVMSVYEPTGRYSRRFTELLKDYYLYL
jgi:tRNA1Val (adenine37-N6)-methyltransferase